MIRITKGLDANSVKGKCMAAKVTAARHGLLFSTIPCTGGCPFNYINGQTEQGRAKIRKYVREIIPSLKTSERLCAVARNYGNFICMKWPAGCSYWKRRNDRRSIEQNGSIVAKFNGCRLNPTDSAGNPLARPWKLATNCPGIIRRFQDLKCRGDHVHAENRGNTLKATKITHMTLSSFSMIASVNLCSSRLSPLLRKACYRCLYGVYCFTTLSHECMLWIYLHILFTLG
jgi:hypothetical protein